MARYVYIIKGLLQDGAWVRLWALAVVGRVFTFTSEALAWEEILLHFDFLAACGNFKTVDVRKTVAFD